MTTDTDTTHTDELVNYGLPQRMSNALISAGLITVDQVFTASADKLISIDLVGSKGVFEIRKAQTRYEQGNPLANGDETVRIILHVSPEDYAAITKAAGELPAVKTFCLHALYDAAGIKHR